MSSGWLEFANPYYQRFHPELQNLRYAVLEITNDLLQDVGASEIVNDIWIVPEKNYHGNLGSTIVTQDGWLLIRIAIARSAEEVADTLLHEIAHVSLGRKHIQKISHEMEFHNRYAELTTRYQTAVQHRLQSLLNP